MKKHIGDITIVVLFLMLCLCFFLNKKATRQIERLDSNNRILTSYTELKRENLALEVLNSSSAMEGLSLASSNGDTIDFCMLSKVLKDGYKLVLRCDVINCESCMIGIRTCLKQFINEEKVRGDILILGNYDTRNEIRTQANAWGVKEVYSIVDDSNTNKINKPHFLIIDENFCIRNIYIPNAYNQTEITVYLNSFLELLKATGLG